MHTNTTDAYIYHLIAAHDWQTAKVAGTYRPDSLATEGFIHASSHTQTAAIANRFYADVVDLLVVVIEVSRLKASVKWEAPAHPDGRANTDDESRERFPHIYGALNVDAVIAVHAMTRTADGTIVLPADLQDTSGG